MASQPPQPDPYEDFVKNLTTHEPALRRFIRTLLPSWGDTDEVVQRTALVAWRKFPQFEPGSDFFRWLLVIARYEALAFRRAMGRDRLCFGENLLALLEEEATEELELATREQTALESCLQKLPVNRRELVLRAYAAGVDQRDIAASLGKSSAALYTLLARIRRDLARCIETQIRTAQ
ncbi:MAG: polymerase sigma factor CnrH [Verrucomicrobiota bacterium]|jgi:RNA polymerase sigma-70 factor (ECF subfamily)